MRRNPGAGSGRGSNGMWHFRRKSAGEKIRNPIQGEFFAQDAIAGPAQALVRESVQNSLDARSGVAPVRVCFTLAAGPHALKPAQVAEIFEGAWPHYAARGNGLHDPPTRTSSCAYLLVEDYGTRGLTGDPMQADPDPDPDRKNAFFMFFRAEGLSGKSGTELGRWGIGKFVFPRSSRASTHFGVTVREGDGRRLLLGAATLKAHRIPGDDAMYTPDGLYGTLAGDGFVGPIEDRSAIDRFCGLFGITRSSEPGLSIVIPFIDEGEITFDALLSAAVHDYFWPILNGQLEISVRSGSQVLELSSATLRQVLQADANLSKDLLPLVELGEFARTVADDARVVLQMHDPARAARWTDALVSPPAVDTIRSRLASREPLAIRVPVTVRPKNSASISSHFDIYLRHDKDSDGRPVFVREGIIISDVRGRRATEMRSLVVIEHRALAGMLGDSENPAHTQWQRDSSNFKGRYTYGKSVIDFVTESVASLLAIVNRTNTEVDDTLTIDFFSIKPAAESDEAEEADEPRRTRKPGDGAESPVGAIQKNPSKIRIARSQGGFSVLPGTAPPPPPYLIEVRCAYETRIGNPLKKWDPADFSLGSAGLPITVEGAATLALAKDNRFLIQVRGNEFRAAVRGFDVLRDVFVRADIREASGGGPED